MSWFDFPTKRQQNSANKIHIVIYVPSTKQFSKPVTGREFKKRIRETAKFLNRTFGGTTRISGIGSYTLNEKIIDERVVKVETFTKVKDYHKADLKVKKFIQQKRRSWGQDSIGYEFEETMHFVK